jgi:hypothetical protein
VLNDSNKEDKPDLPIICGITEDGKKITLFKCFRNNRHFNSNGLESSSFETLYMFVGLLMPEEELKFKYQCSISGFRQMAKNLWLSKKRIQ